MVAAAKPKMRTVDMAYIALFAVVMAVCAWISIPAAVPFTLQTFGVFLAVGLLGGKRGTLAVLIYLLLGAVGIPVFAGFNGGLGYMLGATGGYIVGRRDLVELCAYRLNAPGLGKELGCTLETPRDMYLGFYYAPGVVCEAIKTAIYAQCMLELLGKNPVPRYCDDHNDIVTCFDAGTADALIGFCQGIQAASPVDSYAAPEPSPEPGYTDEVVMASGSFTQGSTIELSCDGPLREPYTCYLQGGLNFAASRAGVLLAIQKAYFKD